MKLNIILYSADGLSKPYFDCFFRTKNEGIHYALDKLLESPKKYVECKVFNSKNELVISIKR